MSTKLRNPFKMRASEKIESDASFLRLFSPIIIEDLVNKHQSQKLWNNVVFIRSSPGGGKTSLLRVFEPSALNTLFNSKSANDYKELYKYLKKIDALDNDRVKVLGASLTCTSNYEILEELNISKANKLRLFFSLLNVRIIISVLKSVLTLKHDSFPEGLDKISFEYKNEDNYYSSISIPCTGKELFEWAAALERNIFLAIDSFLPIEQFKIEGHNELFSLLTLSPKTIKYDGSTVADNFLIMLDDTHKLSVNQREALIKHVIEKRGNFSIWISERLEALDSKDNLRSYYGRDYEELNIEKFWKDSPNKFEKILSNISNKRAAISTEDVTSFEEYLSNDLDEETIKELLLEEQKSTNDSISEIAKHTNRYDEWIDYVNEYEGTTLEKVILLKKVEILIHRSNNKRQLSLPFAYTKSELEDKLKSDIDSAAKLFISRDTNIPYYFSFSSLTKLSSNNIEQFLSFASELYEQMISNRLSGDTILLNAKKQDEIVKAIVEQKWKETARIVPYSKEVTSFLNSLGDFSNKETYRPNAPYAPGVNGFTIKVNEANLLPDEGMWYNNNLFEPLLNVISTCLAFNLLETKEVFQGKKDSKHTVYYLNRWLCVKFDLPLSYGLFRHKSPDELLKWIKK